MIIEDGKTHSGKNIREMAGITKVVSGEFARQAMQYQAICTDKPTKYVVFDVI